jgi:hypothetical protein
VLEARFPGGADGSCVTSAENSEDLKAAAKAANKEALGGGQEAAAAVDSDAGAVSAPGRAVQGAVLSVEELAARTEPAVGYLLPPGLRTVAGEAGQEGAASPERPATRTEDTGRRTGVRKTGAGWYNGHSCFCRQRHDWKKKGDELCSRTLALEEPRLPKFALGSMQLHIVPPAVLADDSGRHVVSSDGSTAT